MFFLRRTRPLRLTAGRLRALRLSLNTPVVATQDLPVGPARAAIALHTEPGRGLQVTVGVRSLACGSVALYGFEGEIASRLLSEAMDGALSFAEGMGFLFDDDVVGDDAASQEKALVRWREAIGDGGTGEPVAAEPDPEEVIELFDLDGGDLTDPPVATALEIELRAAGSLASQDARAEARAGLDFQVSGEAPTLPLTKFRARADTPDAKVALDAEEAIERAPRGPGRRPLGRVRLVKRRANEPAQDPRQGWLLRLLTSF
jgi:hypothetical protein